MKRSNATPLIALGLAGLVAGFLLELAAAASGSPILVPPLTLPLTLLAVGVVVVVLAWPIRQSTRGRRNRRPVNPFMAMRVAVLAKASSLCGALMLGAGLGIVLYLLSRSVLPAVPSVWLAVATAAGAAVLLAGGLVAEHFCTLPPGNDSENAGEASV